MNFPAYMFAPFERHFDGGFGAMADAFREAAAELLGGEPKNSQHVLPGNYLLRHAVELYLKSNILILHRALKLPFADGTWNSEPAIAWGSDVKRLRNLHSIKALSDHVIGVLRENLPRLAASGTADWTDPIPTEYNDWIDMVDTYDTSSTFFRYPVTKHSASDAEKSQFKQRDLEAEFGKREAGGPPVHALVFVDDEYVVQEAFVQDHEALASVRDALPKLAEHLSAMNLALRMDLAGGW